MEFVLSDLCQQVMTARAAERPIYIRGGGTKSFYGEVGSRTLAPDSAVLDMSAYKGVVNYQPSELVITACAGTPLTEIEQLLDQHQQMLAFEPPRFGPECTIGGCVAAGLSGPRRMAAGSVRDFVLGAKLLDSSGAILNFGGEVMKNVAGYDVSRLLAGSMGIFGALLEVSIKVAPKPFQERTVILETDQAGALALFNQWRGQPVPITATAWQENPESGDGLLYVRVSGSEPAVLNGLARVGGTALEPSQANAFWDSIRDHTHPFFQARPLWRVAVPPHTPPLQGGDTLIEWNGGLRWLANVDSGEDLRSQVSKLGGHATLFRYDALPPDTSVFHPLSQALKNINQRLKQELDPAGIFNPKRLFSDF